MANSSLTQFGSTAKALSYNPLGIIALFIVLVYGMACLVIMVGGGSLPGDRVPIVYFLIVFPFVVLAVFTYLVAFKAANLFHPGDFKNAQIYLELQKMHFKIGREQVTADRLDVVLTARLRELEEQIEALRTPPRSSTAASSSPQVEGNGDIPKALEAILIDTVYPMLDSNLWLGRYVSTLAKAASVSDETMLSFCRTRSDIGLFEDGNRWVAALRERLDNRWHPKS